MLVIYDILEKENYRLDKYICDGQGFGKKGIEQLKNRGYGRVMKLFCVTLYHCLHNPFDGITTTLAYFQSFSLVVLPTFKLQMSYYTLKIL